MYNFKRYPFQDTITPYIGDEIWVGVPGFEGSFQVSNLGRVRSLDREVSHSRCGTQFVKGRILRQNIKKHYNWFTNDYIFILRVTLMFENKPHEFSVRRLVYSAFMDTQILKSDKRVVISVDGDGLNCSLNNLKLLTKSEHVKLIVSRDRTSNYLLNVDRSIFKPTFKLWKPVHRCDQYENILETYPSITNAVKKTGFYEKGISNAAKKRTIYRGYRWKFADAGVLDPIKEAYQKKARVRKRKP